MDKLNEILHELGISKVKLAKFLGVSLVEGLILGLGSLVFSQASKKEFIPKKSPSFTIAVRIKK